jgi:hypothetical protein
VAYTEQDVSEHAVLSLSIVLFTGGLLSSRHIAVGSIEGSRSDDLISRGGVGGPDTFRPIALWKRKSRLGIGRVAASHARDCTIDP